MNREGAHVVMNRNGAVAIVDDKGRERERYSVVYGAKLKVGRRPREAGRDNIVEWDPYTFSILTEVGGTVQFKDLAGRRNAAGTGGRSYRLVAMGCGGCTGREVAACHRHQGKTSKNYLMPSRAHLMVQEGDEASPGDVLAKIPRETTKTKDITGGLPRVVELFEARKPHEPAVITEIDGMVKFGEVSKGSARFVVVR